MRRRPILNQAELFDINHSPLLTGGTGGLGLLAARWAEVGVMDPQQRLLLERGYEAVHMGH